MINLADAKIMRYTHAPTFLCRMRTPTKVIFKFDVPHLTGTSTDRSTIFIDRGLKRYMKGKDVVQFLLVYEKAKTALVDLYGLDKQRAHEIASLGLEHKAVTDAGIKWDDYGKFMFPQWKSVNQVKAVPRELDISGYEPKERDVLTAKMPKAQPEQKSFRTQKKEKDARTLHQGQLSKLQRRKDLANVV